MWMLTHAFFAETFSQWMQLWHFKLVWMIAHGRFEGNLRLQVPGKVVGESRRSVPGLLRWSGLQTKDEWRRSEFHLVRCRIEFWPHWISTRGVLIQRAVLRIQRIFMPPAWKVRRGHLVIGSSVRPSVCLSVRPSVCLSVRNSVPLTNNVQYLKFGWWYSNQTWTVASSMGSSHFTDITCPWGWGVKTLDLEIFAIFWLCCRRGHPCFTNTCLVHVELRPPETGGHCITTPPTDKIWTPVELWPPGLNSTLNYDPRSWFHVEWWPRVMIQH